MVALSTRRVTLAEVARRAGVSPTTASFVLSGRGQEMRISPEVEQRVMQTAREAQYRPNMVSASLRTGSTRTIGFVSDTVATSRFAGDLIKGAVETARDRGFLLFIGETEGEAELEQGLIHAMHDRQVDGIVFASMYTRTVAVPEALEGVPAVLLNAVAQRASALPSVVPDELEAGRTAARLLVEAGHREGIHLIGAGPGPRNVPRGGVAAKERLTGIREVLAAAGTTVAGGQMRVEWEPEDGFAATQAVLRAEHPRALICFNDRLAMGAYEALRAAGLEIGRDVSVVSFDDDPLASWLRPGLTSIAIPHYELGRRAVDALFDEMDRAAPGERGRVIRVPMPARARASVQPPAPAGSGAGAA